MAKYKKGDVLITGMGKIFTISGVRSKKQYKTLTKQCTGVYLLNNHPFKCLPISYIDSHKGLSLASKAAQILYGK